MVKFTKKQMKTKMRKYHLGRIAIAIVIARQASRLSLKWLRDARKEIAFMIIDAEADTLYGRSPPRSES